MLGYENFPPSLVTPLYALPRLQKLLHILNVASSNNVLHGRAAYTSEQRTRASGALLSRPPHHTLENISIFSMSSQHDTSSSTKEGRGTLALQALKNDASLTVRRAALLYSVSGTTFRRRRAGIATRCNTPPNSRKLSELEELAIVRRILDLDSRGFLPRLIAVR